MAGGSLNCSERRRARTGTLLSILLSTIYWPAPANADVTVCSLGDIEREIEIVSPGRKGLSRLCEVYYVKTHEGVAESVIWHAHKTPVFCVERAAELLSHLGNAGWSCRDRLGSNEAQTKLSESDVAPADADKISAQNNSASSATIINSQAPVDTSQSFLSASRLISEARARGNNRAGSGEISLSYQMQHTSGIELKDFGFFDVGATDQHAVIFDVNYWLTDKVRVKAGIPYIMKRYVGSSPHDPSTIIPAVDSPLIDDGLYHGNFQDVYFGLAYRATDGPLKIEPFLNVSFPVSDYPFFAGAAIGQHLKKLEIGSSFTYVPPLDDYYISLSASYTFEERTLGYNVDHVRLNLDVGYFLTPRFSVRGFVSAKQGNGISAIDFPDTTSIMWYHHDQLVRHSYINIGAGFAWAIDKRNVVQVNALRTVRAVDLFPTKYGIVVSFIRSF